MEQNQYPVVITDRERDLGYNLETIPNPGTPYLGETETINAVIYYLDSDNCIIKTGLNGKNIYSHQRLTNGKWSPVSGIESDPEVAIRLARELILNEF